MTDEQSGWQGRLAINDSVEGDLFCGALKLATSPSCFRRGAQVGTESDF